MKLQIKEMDEKKAVKILSWRYEKPYHFYNNKDTEESRAELLNGTYQAVVNEEEQLVGFFCTGASAQVPIGKGLGMYDEHYIDLGLGMHPARTGKGQGISFCTFILEHLEQQYPQIPVRLTVATFNRRAIHLYRKLGFVQRNAFNTDAAYFIIMMKSE